MPKDSLQYLLDNGLTITTGLFFTCNDYRFIVTHGYQKIVINQEHYLRKETLTKKDIVRRIADLYCWYKVSTLELNKIDESKIIQILIANQKIL